MISPLLRHSFLLSSRTVFILSIQTASTGPSNTYQRLSSLVAAAPWRINVDKIPSVLVYRKLFGKCNRKNSKCNVTLSIFYCYFYGRRYSQDRSSYHSWVRASNSPYSWPIVMDLGLSTNVCVAVNIKPAGDSWPTRADWAAFNTS